MKNEPKFNIGDTVWTAHMRQDGGCDVVSFEIDSILITRLGGVSYHSKYSQEYEDELGPRSLYAFEHDAFATEDEAWAYRRELYNRSYSH